MTQLQLLIKEKKWQEAFDLLAQPLHERLYAAQSFDILDTFTPLEKGILTLDYVQTQVTQGGFIQFIQNGYIQLLVPLIESLQAIAVTPDLVQVLDDVLKVYVLNQDILAKETSVEEFARLYNEFSEFEALETRFDEEAPGTVKALLALAVAEV